MVIESSWEPSAYWTACTARRIAADSLLQRWTRVDAGADQRITRRDRLKFRSSLRGDLTCRMVELTAPLRRRIARRGEALSGSRCERSSRHQEALADRLVGFARYRCSCPGRSRPRTDLVRGNGKSGNYRESRRVIRTRSVVRVPDRGLAPSLGEHNREARGERVRKWSRHRRRR
jgi:hypothetical protein